MVTVIALAALFAVLYLAYRTGRRKNGGQAPRRTPSPRGRGEFPAPAPLPATVPPPGTAPATPAEAREAALTHQLLAGSLAPAAYRSLMAELAHSHPGHHDAGHAAYPEAETE